MSQSRNRSHGGAGSKSRSKSNSRSRSRSLSSTSSGRAATAPKWDGESGYRLHVSPLNPRTSRRDIEKIFTKFGTINEVWMATNPPCFAFVNFKHRADAEDAVQALDGKMIDNSRVGISFARKRTIGGRRGGSYNNGGDRYSRGGGGGGGDYDSSRNRRRYSPRQDDRRRRYSRSRSPVQSSKRDHRQRSRSKSSSPKTRRNRPSSRDRSPQQQAVNVVRRYSDNDDRSE
jgi:arginine/serine-rich splicing factor 7